MIPHDSSPLRLPLCNRPRAGCVKHRSRLRIETRGCWIPLPGIFAVTNHYPEQSFPSPKRPSHAGVLNNRPLSSGPVPMIQRLDAYTIPRLRTAHVSLIFACLFAVPMCVLCTCKVSHVKSLKRRGKETHLGRKLQTGQRLTQMRLQRTDHYEHERLGIPSQ